MAYGNGNTMAGRPMNPPTTLPPNMEDAKALAVPAEMDNQRHSISLLLETVSELEARLLPVLGPAGPTGESAGIALKPDTLAQAIRENGERVHGANQRLRELLSRLEL